MKKQTLTAYEEAYNYAIILLRLILMFKTSLMLILFILLYVLHMKG